MTTLTKARIRAGVWEGILSGTADAPALEVLLLGAVVPGIGVAAVPDRAGEWAVRVPMNYQRLPSIAGLCEWPCACNRAVYA